MLNLPTFINIIIGFAIFLFMLSQVVWLVIEIILRIAKPNEKRKFPIIPIIILFFCCSFYTIAFLLDYFNIW